MLRWTSVKVQLQPTLFKHPDFWFIVSGSLDNLASNV